MRIFLDTADTAVIRKHWDTGLIDGVTTNPTLMMKAGRNVDDVYQEIKDIGVTDISMEVVGSGAEMINEGLRLHNKEGLLACRTLFGEGINVNVTLIFSAAQAVLAARAGAKYVSPFVGRLDDQSVAGLEVVRSISELYRIHGCPTQVLAASIRSVQRAVRSWYNGAQVVTMPPNIFEQMHNHILTDKGLELFDRDWKSVQDFLSTQVQRPTDLLQ